MLIRIDSERKVKKIITSIIMISYLIPCIVIHRPCNAYGADTSITLDSSATGFVCIEDDTQFTDMEPAETREAKIRISNNSGYLMDFYINGQILDNIADSPDSDKCAIYRIQLYKDGENIPFYDGITGLKTGSTSKAKYCLSATAKRNGLNLIAVIMAAPDHKVRFSEAQALLDYGFANCSLYQDDYSGMKFNSPSVRGGIPEKLTVYPKKSFSHTFTAAYDKNKIKKKITYQELKAPIKKGTAVGFITYSYQGKTLGKVPLLAMQNIKKAGYTDYLLMALDRLLMAG